jgi:hypothetical protein
MAYTTIDDPSAHFQVKTYSGNSTQTAITFDGNSNLQPDWIWAKQRGGSHYHDWRDTSRGLTKRLVSAVTDAEGTKSASYVSFDSNGFTLGDDQQGGSNANTVNSSSNNYVSWCWKANGGTLTTNDASATSVGTHDSQYQANTTAGFSIVTWTGNAEQETLAHGLGAIPEMIWIKNRADSEGWWVGATPAGNMSDGKYLLLNTNDGTATNSTSFVNQNPTSTVFRVGGSNSTADNAVNGNGDNMIAYCFTSIKGYSKIGSYTGNGSSDGTFVYTGFKPAFLLFKLASASGEHWRIFDNKRSPSNQVGAHLFASVNGAESSETGGDFLSNGFKWRNSDDHQNGSGKTYIYMAFAEHPFVSSKGVPVTAR